MSFVTTMKSMGEDFHVLDLKNQVSSVVDSRGAKAGSVKATKTKFTVEATSKNAFLTHLLGDQFVPLPEMEFVAFNQIEKSEMRKIANKESILVGFSLDIDIFSDTIATYTVEVTSRVCDTNGVLNEQNWQALTA